LQRIQSFAQEVWFKLYLVILKRDIYIFSDLVRDLVSLGQFDDINDFVISDHIKFFQFQSGVTFKILFSVLRLGLPDRIVWLEARIVTTTTFGSDSTKLTSIKSRPNKNRSASLPSWPKVKILILLFSQPLGTYMLQLLLLETDMVLVFLTVFSKSIIFSCFVNTPL